MQSKAWRLVSAVVRAFRTTGWSSTSSARKEPFRAGESLTLGDQGHGNPGDPASVGVEGLERDSPRAPVPTHSDAHEVGRRLRQEARLVADRVVGETELPLTAPGELARGRVGEGQRRVQS